MRSAQKETVVVKVYKAGNGCKNNAKV